MEKKKLIAGFGPYQIITNILIYLTLAQTLSIEHLWTFPRLIHNHLSQHGIELFPGIVRDLWLISHFR